MLKSTALHQQSSWHRLKYYSRESLLFASVLLPLVSLLVMLNRIASTTLRYGTITALLVAVVLQCDEEMGNR